MDELNADMVFQKNDRSANCSWRFAKPSTRAGQAPFIERGNEHFHGIDAVHQRPREGA